MKQAITFPRGGIYTPLFKDLVEKLGAEVMLPPPITQKTVKLGVKYSSDFMCFPFKITLGNLIETLEIAKQQDIKLIHLGVGYSNIDKGSCRFQHYFEIQKRILKDSGYDLEMYMIEGKNIFKFFKRINPKNNYIKIVKVLWNSYKEVRKLEKQFYTFDWNDKKKVRIGIVGEWYTAIANEINYNMFNKLKKMGVNVHQSSCATLSGFLKHQVHLEDIPKRYIKMGEEYYGGLLQAHARYSLWNMFYYKEMGFDSVIHLMPLSCMPESTVEMLMDLVSKKLNLPVHHFPIDEEVFQTGTDMRIKSIVRILERSKNAIQDKI